DLTVTCAAPIAAAQATITVVPCIANDNAAARVPARTDRRSCQAKREATASWRMSHNLSVIRKDGTPSIRNPIAPASVPKPIIAGTRTNAHGEEKKPTPEANRQQEPQIPYPHPPGGEPLKTFPPPTHPRPGPLARCGQPSPPIVDDNT